MGRVATAHGTARSGWCLPAALAALCLCVLGPALRAQESLVTLDPVGAEIRFTLGATLHTVHGSFKLKQGELSFDPATGNASGSIVVDATSGNTDNGSRDKKMHAEILESARFPEITFTATRIKGPLQEIANGPFSGTVDLEGVFHLHGQDHAGSAKVAVDRRANGEMRVTATFAVPYVSWGVKDPSTTFLHVKDAVDVEVRAAARITPANPPPPKR